MENAIKKRGRAPKAAAAAAVMMGAGTADAVPSDRRSPEQRSQDLWATLTECVPEAQGFMLELLPGDYTQRFRRSYALPVWSGGFPVPNVCGEFAMGLLLRHFETGRDRAAFPAMWAKICEGSDLDGSRPPGFPADVRSRWPQPHSGQPRRSPPRPL